MNIDLLSGLIGNWEGEGIATFPTITTTPYTENTTFTLDSGIIHYTQKTWKSGQLSHWESGFIRFSEPEGLIWANVQGNGRVEVLHPIELTAGSFTFQSVHFGNDPRMQAATRTLTLTDNALNYTMEMHTTTHPSPALHLEATLHRVP